MKTIKAIFTRFLRNHYAVPVILLAATTILLVNELNYQRTLQVVRGGIELTDARIQTARVLQLLTDAETGQRGFILTGHKDFLRPYQAALDALPALRSQLQKYFNTTRSDAETRAQKADGVIGSKLAELAKVLELQEQGQHAAAIDLIASGDGRELMEDLRNVFSTELERAGRAQAQVRISIYDALQFNRVAAALLTLASTAGLLIFLRQLRLHDDERAAREMSLESLIRTRMRELRHLARHLQTVREDERGYLAREIHDELGGLLTAAKLPGPPARKDGYRTRAGRATRARYWIAQSGDRFQAQSH